MSAAIPLGDYLQFFQREKPEHIPEAIWGQFHGDSMFILNALGRLKSCIPLLIGDGPRRLFRLLGRKPNRAEMTQGARAWTDADYVSWLTTHRWVWDLYVARDVYGAYHDIKDQLATAAQQARNLAATLRELDALDLPPGLLPASLNNLAFAYGSAVWVNHGRGGHAKHIDELTGEGDETSAGSPIRDAILMHGQRGSMPSLADLMEGVVEEITDLQRRKERMGQYGFSIDNYTPDSLVARYVALFDAGLDSSVVQGVEPFPRLSHEAMSVQCSLLFPDETMTKERIIDIRKRIKRANPVPA
jgi:hypothetical protein